MFLGYTDPHTVRVVCAAILLGMARTARIAVSLVGSADAVVIRVVAAPLFARHLTVPSDRR